MNGNRVKAISISRHKTVRFLFVGMGKERSVQNKDGYTRRIAVILDAAGCIKKRVDQLRRTAHDLRTRFAKCREVDGGILDLLL
jgi:hypothetical protein